MPTRTESIAAFLKAYAPSDLAALYTYAMECQVNVAQDQGTPIAGEYQGRKYRAYTDGIQTWKPFRIPFNAAVNPTYEDKKMSYNLDEHAEGIGMTGWDWQKRLSRWVAFDFDAITGHKESHRMKVDETNLEQIKEQASQIPWVTVRKSAGGRGLHLYVFFEPCVLTQNHNEHAALARAVLGKMSALAKFDFESKVDICGGNMWVWHRKIKGNDGLALIKKGEPLKEIPPNWKDHVKVITGHKKKNIPKFINPDSETESEQERFFLELTGQNTRIDLDEEHNKLVKWLEENNKQAWWDSDHHMLVTHTADLKDAHTQLSLKGIFETQAKGTESGHDHNCFAFPIRNGGWAIRRYSMGAVEAPSWDQDGRGWTRCFYNVPPDLWSVSRAKGGIESPTGGFVFNEAEQAVEAARVLGAKVQEIPHGLRSQRSTLKPHKDGRLIVEIEGDKGRVADKDMGDWLHNKGKWQKIFNINTKSPVTETDTSTYDDLVRHILTGTGEDYGWALRSTNGEWSFQPLKNVQLALESMNISGKDIKSILGTAVLKSWKLVNKPFQAEYPGDREWNLYAAQFRYTPSQSENLHHPTWNSILNHVGHGLNDAVLNSSWCKINGIQTGGDYLKLWVASMFKEPQQPLPYLFLYSTEQVTGKSTFHEALSLLMTRGFARADAALINQQAFNDELKNAVLCAVEEINLRKNKDANNRIKDWVTATHLPIHPKGGTPYHIPNTTHWIQTANEPDFCPIFPGDTRITMIYVPPLDPLEMKPKKELFPKLEAEASDFLASVLRLEIPPSNDRLNIPMLATATKMEVAQSNETPLQTFIRERCFYVPGEMIIYSEFYEVFARENPEEVEYWTKKRVGKELPSQYPKARRSSDGQFCIGNLSFKPPNLEFKPKPKLISWTNSEKGYSLLVPEDHDKR